MNIYEIKIRIPDNVASEHVLNLLYIFESISERFYKMIINNEDEFSYRLNDVNITFQD